MTSHSKKELIRHLARWTGYSVATMRRWHDKSTLGLSVLSDSAKIAEWIAGHQNDWGGGTTFPIFATREALNAFGDCKLYWIAVGFCRWSEQVTLRMEDGTRNCLAMTATGEILDEHTAFVDIGRVSPRKYRQLQWWLKPQSELRGQSAEVQPIASKRVKHTGIQTQYESSLHDN